MPPTMSRIACAAAIFLLLAAGASNAQSGSGQGGTDTASSSHTISFSFGDYDVISTIYVFLTSGNQQTTCVLEISSIERRTGGLLPLPVPVSLDLLYRAAIDAHHQEGDFPCDDVTFDASLSGDANLSSIIFTLLSLLHLSDHWIYSVECGGAGEDPLISFLDYLGGSLLLE